MKNNTMRVSENESIGDKILYGILCCLFYPIKYLSLIPHFLMSRTFRKLPTIAKSSVCVEESQDGKIYRHYESVDGLQSGFQNYKSITDILVNCSKNTPNKNCIGSRPVIKKVDYVEEITCRKLKHIEFGPYEWKTFDKVLSLVKQYAYGLASIGVIDKPSSRVALFADNCEEWFILSQAILFTGSQVVTVYPTLHDDGILHAVNSVEANYIIVDEKCLTRFLKLSTKWNFIKHVILMSSCESDQYSQTSSKNLFQFYTIDELYQKGHEIMNSPTPATLQPTCDDEIAVIMFTSGSTGEPKGVLISHKNILTQVGSESNRAKEWADHKYIAFLPSSHILEYVVELSILSYGGSIGFGSPLTLTSKSPMVMPGSKGDLDELNPTIAIFVPLLLDRLSKNILQHLRKQSKFQQNIIQFLIDYKTHFVKMGHTTKFIDKVVFSKIATVVGGNIRVTISAGAPLCNQLSDFCNVVLCLNLIQGYGTTETCCGGSLGRAFEPYSFDVGSITPSVEIKLVPWEEGGYSPNDLPYPRGEINISGDSVAHGYFNKEELNKEVFYVDSNNKRWFRTGDIGQIISNGNLQIIDRKKDIVKLKHGEYVSISAVEGHLMKSKFVDMICVAPNVDSSYLVAIIVPNRLQIANLVKLENKELDDDFSIHINDVSIRKIMKQDISKIAYAELNKFDRPEKYFFVCELWSAENCLTTPSMKIKRSEIHRFYSHFLE